MHFPHSHIPTFAQSAIENALGLYAIAGAGDVKRLSERPGFRLRVGEYRVVFTEDATTVLAIYAGRRNTHTYD